jgi:hypothetical protein
MPKNTVSDPITGQEMAFAHLVLSGTMNDRRAAEAVGLNPDTAAYTKSKPRVRAYMIEHRTSVRERLVDQEAAGLRKLNLGRDQILDRLWELANLSSEATRGSITGQVKALSMIVAIEGLIPSGTMNDRRSSPTGAQPAARSAEAEWLREQNHEPASETPGNPVAGTKTRPAVPQVRDPELTAEPAPKTANDSLSSILDRNQTSPLNPFVKPEALNRVPAATGFAFDAILDRANDRANPITRSFSPNGRFSGRRR